MYAQSGRTRSCTGAAASSSSAGKGQPSPRSSVPAEVTRNRPAPTAQARTISRWDSPSSWLSRRTCRIFIICSLHAGIALPSPSERRSVPRSGYRRALTTLIHFGRRDPLRAGFGDPLRPDQVIHFNRIRRSTSTGVRSQPRLVSLWRPPKKQLDRPLLTWRDIKAHRSSAPSARWRDRASLRLVRLPSRPCRRRRRRVVQRRDRRGHDRQTASEPGSAPRASGGRCPSVISVPSGWWPR